MNGLKEFFPGPVKLWAIMLIFAGIAFSCLDGCTCRGCDGCNGCTTSVVIDQEARKIKADGIKMKVIANKNKVINRKLKLDSVLYIDKKIWYSIDYHLKVEKRPEIRNICEFESSQNFDLDEAIDQFVVKFSPDKQHFAVGLGEKVYDFFHFLKDGVPFSSGCFYVNDSSYTFLQTANISFSNINWKVFPQPDVILDKIIVPNSCAPWALACNQRNVLSLLSDMPVGNSHEMVLIENWYCEIADLHFTQARVQEIVKVSPKWKATAIKNLIKEIDNAVSEDDSKLDKSLDMVLWINDGKTLQTADSIVFDDYFALGFAGDYLYERLKNNQTRLNDNIRISLLKTAKEKCQNFQTENKKMPEEKAIEILLFFQDYELLKNFLNQNISPEILVDDYFNISGVTIRLYELYPKDLQELMVKNYTGIVQRTDTGLSGFDITEIMDFLKEKIPCSKLRELVALHKTELNVFTMPKNCPE